MNQNKAKNNTVIMSRARTDLGSHSEPPLTKCGPDKGCSTFVDRPNLMANSK